MMAMFRFIYGLPYPGEEAYWHDNQSVAPHARVYVVAEKYQVTELKNAVMDVLLSILLNDKVEEDPASALHTNFSATLDTDNEARPLLVKNCVSQLSFFKKRQDFTKLLKDCAEIGAAMLTHEDLIPGSWTCSGPSECRGIPNCPQCDVAFERSTYKKDRKQSYWYCWACNGSGKP